MADPNDSPYLTFNETLKVLAEFLEVAIHNILCIRGVYPADLFERRQKYEVPVFRSRHDELNDFIADVVLQSSEEIAKGTVSKLIIAIQDDTVSPPEPLEHFVFDIEYLIDPLTTFATSGRDERPTSGATTFKEVQLRLRAFLLKLSVCEASLIDLPEDLTWTTFLEMRNSTSTPSTEAARKAGVTPHWIPADATTFRDLPASGSDRQPDTRPLPPPVAIPLKSIGMGMVNLQLLVEEHPRKADMLRKDQLRMEGPAAPKKDVKGKGKAAVQ